MLIGVRKFGGMLPSRSTDLLEPGQAQGALNVRLSGGDLRPMKDLGSTLVTLNGVPQVNSIYRFGQALTSTTQYWFQSVADVDWVRGPVLTDTTERTYWTDGTFPKKTDSTIATASTPYPSASYAMGIPAPAAAPTLAVTGTATTPSDPGEAVNYVMTYTTAWGEEGPPSQASNTVTWRAGQTLSLTGLSTSPGTGGAGQNYSVNGKRLYRAATGTAATQYQFDVTVGTLALATTTTTSTTVTANLTDVLETLGWLEPPAAMLGLCAGPNGILAGFTGNTVCFSVPYAPYAWPVRYQQSTDGPVVGIAWFDQTLFVGSTQAVYLITGADPANMTVQKLASKSVPIAKRSIVSMQGGVLYAGSDGVYRIDGSGGPQNLTQGIMTRDDWQVYASTANMWAAESDNRYIVFYNNGSVTKSLIFDFSPTTPSFSESDTYAFAGYRDTKAAGLFVVTSGNTLKQYDNGAALTYLWTSGVFHLPAEVNMGAAAVDASAYPVTFRLYADGTLKHTQTVANAQAFRLPSGYRSRRYHFSVQGTGVVRDIEVASTMAELTTQ